MPTTADGSVKLFMPAWIWGRKPREFLAAASLIGKQLNDEPSTWQVRTEEAYAGQRPRLFTMNHLAGPGTKHERYEQVSGRGVPNQVRASDAAIVRVNQIGDEAAQSGKLVDMVTYSQLAWLVAPDEQLADLARHIHSEVRNIPFAEEVADHPFSNSGVHFIYRDPCLINRIKIPSVWLRIKYDPRMGGPNPNLSSDERAEGLHFKSAFDLHDGMLMMDAYFAPLLGALSPYIWGFFAPKPFGVLILSLGIGINDSRQTANELLRTLATQGSTQSIPPAQLEPNSCGTAIDWWTDGLNKLFGVLGDPAVFRDANGYYNAPAQLEAFLTIEQLFRRVLSIQASHHDKQARHVLLFSVLDTLDQLTGRNFEVHCTLSYAQKALTRLQQAMPTDATNLLLHRAQHSVDALQTMQRGFFINVAGSRISVPRPTGESQDMSLEDAVAHYLKLLRDANHGHGAVSPNKVDRTRSLLAMHSGEVPEDIGWLGYLYLLDVLTQTDLLKGIWSARARDIKR